MTQQTVLHVIFTVNSIAFYRTYSCITDGKHHALSQTELNYDLQSTRGIQKVMPLRDYLMQAM